jgi:type II secretory pathway component GspD/PulD (secretin)
MNRSRHLLLFAAFVCAACTVAQAAGKPALETRTQEIKAAAAKPQDQKPTDPEQQIMSPLDVKDADIQDVIRTISKGYNLNIILDKDVSGKVTVHLSDVPIIEGLRTLAKSNNLDVVKEGNVYRIRKTEAEQRSVISYIKGKLTVDVQNIDVKDFLKDISAKTAISIVPDAKVEGKITGKLFQVDLDDGLRALLDGSGLKLVKRRNIYQVETGEGTAGQGQSMPPPYPGYGRSMGPGGRASTSFYVDCSGGKISIDVTNGNLQDVIKAIAEQSEMQIITYGTISGEINAKLKNVPLTEALALLLGGTMFTFVQKDSIILIGDRNAATPSGQALSKSELIHLNCIKADGVMQILPKDIPPSNVKVIKEQNALLVSGTSEDIVSVREFLNTIDIPTPQVTIDAVIVEYKENLNKEFGVNAWLHRNDTKNKSFRTSPTFKSQVGDASSAVDIGATGASIKDLLYGIGSMPKIISKIPDDFFFLLHYLEAQDAAKVLAQPSIVTLNGNKATINVSETQYFKITTGTALQGDYSLRFQPITFGIKLDITPWISKGGQITAEIAPEVSNSDGVNPDGNYPNVSTRAITTTVRLNDGETIILGGLVKNQETYAKQKIPFLGDIPLIGALFRTNVKTRTKSNLVVYITPHILTNKNKVNLRQELENLDKSNREFMEKKIEDSINKTPPEKAMDINANVPKHDAVKNATSKGSPVSGQAKKTGQSVTPAAQGDLLPEDTVKARR